MPVYARHTCLVCAQPFHSIRPNALYCSNAHRQKAYRDKRFTPQHAPVQRRRNRKPNKRTPNRPPGVPKRTPNKRRARK